MALEIEMLDTQEAPLSAAEGIAYAVIAFEVGVIAGMLIT